MQGKTCPGLRRSTALWCVGLGFCSVAAAADEDLTTLDLGTLMRMDVTVTSAAKRAQLGADAAAAVFVITRDDIARSTATSIPELLRFVPGLQVARSTNSRWAVSARGFNSHYSNKLLVLVDGRSIYTPQFGGVVWEEQHVPLAEIERIEIVRGPGGALWGANATNGVINIITHTAAESRGLRFTGGTGTDEDAAGLRYGGSAGQLGDYRVYAEHFSRDAFMEGITPWQLLQAGWRLDGAAAGGHFTFQGDFSENDLGEYLRGGVFLPALVARNGNINAGWQGKSFGDGELELQGTYTFRRADKYGIDSDEGLTDLGFELQYSAARAGRHLLTLGAGTHYLTDDLRGQPGTFAFTPARTTQRLWSLYAQDEIHFLADDLRFILGGKLEHFEFTGAEFQPTARAIWRLNERHSLWAAASKAVRTPSRFELHAYLNTFSLPGDPPLQFALLGNPNLDAEGLRAYELGWRWRPAERMSLDLALFEQRYDGLMTLLPAAPFFDAGPPAALVFPSIYQNSLDPHSRGAELAFDWIVNAWLRLQANGGWLDVSGSPSNIVGSSESGDAKHSFSARARIDLPRHVELDLAWRRVAAIPSYAIDAYDSADVRLGWRPSRQFGIELAIDNVFDQKHTEYFDEESVTAGAVLGRSVFGRLIWQPGR